MRSLDMSQPKRRRPVPGVLAATVLSPVLLLAAAPAGAQQTPPYYGPHMWEGAWWMFFGPLTMVLFIAAIVAVVVLIARWLAPPSHGGSGLPPARTPLVILQERFVRGEIDKEEFAERRRVLGA